MIFFVSVLIYDFFKFILVIFTILLDLNLVFDYTSLQIFKTKVEEIFEYLLCDIYSKVVFFFIFMLLLVI